MSDDLIYYDILSTNFQTETFTYAVTFNETRVTPIITNPSLYNMSIARFSLDTCLLPVIVPTIRLETDNPNETVYSITMQYNNNGIITDSDQIFLQ
jgi:hypothetical protein